MAWTDLAERLLKTAIQTFKTDAIYIPAKGVSYPISGVFDRPNQFTDPETGAPVSSTSPTFGVNLDDLESPPQPRDRIQIGLIQYLITEEQPDGQHGAKLMLQVLG